jgi:predicted nucleic acid-binding Zn ribbon protein
VHIGEVLQKVIKNLGLERKLKEARIAREWESVVGSRIAAHCRPVSIKGSTIIVNVDSSVWLSELNNFFKDKLLDRLQAEFKELRIHNIKFRIGEI